MAVELNVIAKGEGGGLCVVLVHVTATACLSCLAPEACACSSSSS